MHHLAQLSEKDHGKIRPDTTVKKLGLIVNPIAGMGGRVGLKGTDGQNIMEQAVALGATPLSPERARLALRQLAPLRDQLVVVTYPGAMGEEEARDCDLEVKVLPRTAVGATTAEDTREAARRLLAEGVDLILFAGGDGTARDIVAAVGENVVAAGIPTGVKMHSAVYASSPAKAGELALNYLLGKATQVQEAEVMDIDEEAFRQGTVTARLYGYLQVPYQRQYLQGAKTASPQNENAAKDAIACDVIDNMLQDVIYIVGPGSTTRPILTKLGLPKSLLGVDLIFNRQVVALDVAEKDLLRHIAGKPAKLIVTPIGGQGFLFGRGNQQLSPAVIRAVGKENILVVATKQKLSSLRGKPFLLDTGDPGLDAALAGLFEVVVGYRDRVIYKVKP